MEEKKNTSVKAGLSKIDKEISSWITFKDHSEKEILIHKIIVDNDNVFVIHAMTIDFEWYKIVKRLPKPDLYFDNNKLMYLPQFEGYRLVNGEWECAPGFDSITVHRTKCVY